MRAACCQATGSAAAAAAPAPQRDLALGAAIGLGLDAVLVFLASLLRASPRCHVVLLTDHAPPRDALEAEGIDGQRVTFEIAGTSLEAPWNGFSIGSTRFKLFKDYLERTHAATAYRFVQLSDVDDVAFQSDPFEWVSRQPAGLHVSSDSPGRTVGSMRSMSLMEVCYGSQAYVQLTAQPFLPVGYVIGSAGNVERYVQAVASELAEHPRCNSQGVEEVVHNALLRGVSGREPPAGELHVSDSRRGPVWTGGKVPKASVVLDVDKFVLDEVGGRYPVLHQYTEHEDLWRALNARFLRGKRRQEAAVDCTGFDVVPGDLRGFDLSHQPADQQRDCCAACLGDPTCGGFVFSAGRRHCWLKRSGGERGVANQGDDVVCGLRRQAGFLPMRPGIL
mmetsp:Transcript_80146/g.248738  ORF Transcript_80146/g.248738 Transcript_80146/m.248738 type:complete len:392 (-) Transcript_80146:64-1239(-)